MSESPPSSLLWDIVRYGTVAAATGLLVWYYFFYTPTEYVSREHAGSTMGTHYIVKVAQFPAHADWNKLSEDIQHRLDSLEQSGSEDVARIVRSILPDELSSELAIDLSMVAKGIAVDSIAELLEEQRIEDYLI